MRLFWKRVRMKPHLVTGNLKHFSRKTVYCDCTRIFGYFKWEQIRYAKFLKGTAAL